MDVVCVCYPKCKWLALTKDIFFNEIVLEKNFYVKSYWLWFCNHVEDPILSTLEFLIPHYLLPDFVMKVCHRPPGPTPLLEEVASDIPYQTPMSDCEGRSEANTLTSTHGPDSLGPAKETQRSPRSTRLGARSLGPAYRDGKRISYEPGKLRFEGKIRQTKLKNPVLGQK